MPNLNDEIEVEGAIDNGQTVTWLGRDGIERVGSVIAYLGEGVYLVNDEDDKEHELSYDDLTVED